MGIGFQKGGVSLFGQKVNLCAGLLLQAAHNRRRENDISDGRKTDNQYFTDVLR